jgi:Tn3 transposase DDE domain
MSCCGSPPPSGTGGRPPHCCCPARRRARALSRPQAGSRRNPLARALQEYGRLIKTNFVLAWLADEQLRQRIGRQLNKGEQLHALRRAPFYANEGHIRHRTPEQQAEQAACLSIVCNAVIVRNTVYTQRVLDELRASGAVITTGEIERISRSRTSTSTSTATTPSTSPADPPATGCYGASIRRPRTRSRRRTASDVDRTKLRRCYERVARAAVDSTGRRNAQR